MRWEYKVLDLTEHSSDPVAIEKAVNDACSTHEDWKVIFIDNDQAWYRVWLGRHVSR